MRMLRAAERILPEIDAMEEEFRALAGRARPGGCTSPSSATPVSTGCSRCWRLFRHAWPEIDVDIRAGLAFEALPALNREDVDLVISSDPASRRRGSCSTRCSTITRPSSRRRRIRWPRRTFITAEDFRDQVLITYPVSRDKLDIFTEMLTPGARWSRARSGRRN